MDRLDRILASEDRLVPSSGFQSRILDAVIAEGMKLPPLPFPWGRFAGGIAACLVWAVAGSVVVERIDWSLFAPVVSAMTSNPGFSYGVAAACGSLAVIAVPRFRLME